MGFGTYISDAAVSFQEKLSNAYQSFKTNHRKKIETVRDGTFFAAFTLRGLKLPVVATIANIVSLVCYSIGYALWFLTSQWYQDKRKPKYALEKNLITISAILGLLGSIAALSGLFIPVLLLPSALLFLVSNTLWCYDECRKYLTDSEPLHGRPSQKIYCIYAIIAVLLSIVSAITAICTIAIGSIPMLLAVSGGIALAGGILSILVWGYYFYLNHKESKANVKVKVDESEALQSKDTATPKPDCTQASTHHPSLFANPTDDTTVPKPKPTTGFSLCRMM